MKTLENFMKNQHIKIIYLVIALFWFPIVVYAQSSADIQAYIAKYSQLALEQEKRYGVPASITLAQGILESAAGKSRLATQGNAHFGIKKSPGWNGAIIKAWDDDPHISQFRSYRSVQESYEDHSKFLRNNSRYRNLFNISVYNYRGWAKGLQDAGYATSPTYAKALVGYIDRYQLYNINGGVKLRPGKTVVIRVENNKPSFDSDYVLNDTEKTEEEEMIDEIFNHIVVQINDVRCTIIYPGENLASISKKYDIPKEKLLEYNEIRNESQLKEGDIVFLEKKKKKYTWREDRHTVQAGETLYSISQRYGVRVACLAKINGKTPFSEIHEDETIHLK